MKMYRVKSGSLPTREITTYSITSFLEANIWLRCSQVLFHAYLLPGNFFYLTSCILRCNFGSSQPFKQDTVRFTHIGRQASRIHVFTCESYWATAPFLQLRAEGLLMEPREVMGNFLELRALLTPQSSGTGKIKGSSMPMIERDSTISAIDKSRQRSRSSCMRKVCTETSTWWICSCFVCSISFDFRKRKANIEAQVRIYLDNAVRTPIMRAHVSDFPYVYSVSLFPVVIYWFLSYGIPGFSQAKTQRSSSAHCIGTKPCYVHLEW